MLEGSYGHLNTLNIKIRPLVHILQVEIHGFANLLRSSRSSSSMKRISMGLDEIQCQEIP